ncbi:tyrosine-type recombinase/integrase [Algoriphagus sanaruensis]|uniref:Integrase n=1 Tax=Algoriphagus sanaruensis TaxID=1727163 RepID=A0A142EPN9_9BACT|nr:site-specific integrase [Algoriphagus sanaruensis]AMQ57094.1 integrase [Algoriphagus sanaruensis]
MAIKVTLRQKSISKGRSSLYLDFYPGITNPKTGENTRREFLKMYVKDPIKFKSKKLGNGSIKQVPIYSENPIVNQAIEQENNNALSIAEKIRLKRENDLNKPEIYSEFEKERLKLQAAGRQDFVDYFRKLSKKRKSSNYDNWNSAIKYLERFTGGILHFSDLNEKFLEEFKHYLLTTKSTKSNEATLSQNSAVSYFNKIKAALKQAYKDGILQQDLNAKVSSIKEVETRREFLTEQELNDLVKKPCKDEILKRAAIFSALTGLRFSDIEKLTWAEVEFITGKGYFLKFQQEKTSGVEYHPISEQAFLLLGERGDLTKKVFHGLKYSDYKNRLLKKWIESAGISKNITFHCFRHSYATLQLTYGTDIYTVSKLLGHRELKTTQIYAKIIDQTKRDAADKIKLDL